MTITQYIRILDAVAAQNWTGALTLHLDNGEVHDLYPVSEMFEGLVVFSALGPSTHNPLPKNPPIAAGYTCIPIQDITTIEFKGVV